MPELFQKGIERIVYKSKNFITGKVITAYIWSPSLVKSSLQLLTELEDGLYYLDYNFNETGTFFGIFHENGITEAFNIFRVMDKLELIYDKINNILKIETGRWKIMNNQLIIYDENNTTVLYVFNLKDKFGNPADKDVFERIPI